MPAATPRTGHDGLSRLKRRSQLTRLPVSIAGCHERSIEVLLMKLVSSNENETGVTW